jgi:hypothetical protein
VNDESHDSMLEDSSGSRLEDRRATGGNDTSGERVEDDVRKLLLARIREKVRRADDR